MTQKHILSLFGLLIITISSFSQNKTAPLKGDCYEAVEIIPNGKYVFKKSPNGVGKTLEFHDNSMKSKYYFSEENHTAWFTFIASQNSTLTFFIQPKDTLADFDFLLFEYTNSNFCKEISQRKIKPIRSNISRNNPKVKSKTGLSKEGTQQFVHSGPGDQFSSILKLEEGQRYYLAINKANDVETPFRLVFKTTPLASSSDSLLITGVLRDEDSGEIIGDADITIETKEGKLISKSKTNSKTGEYIITVPKTEIIKPYLISVEKTGFFYSEKTIKIANSKPIEPLALVIPKLAKGKNLNLHNILFIGNEATVIPNSKSSLKRLYRLMKKNNSLKILIAGHTNGCGNGRVFSQKLSDDRAKKVKKYLIMNGIDENRISTKGYGCSKMLYPNATSLKEQELNRRVEISVMDY